MNPGGGRFYIWKVYLETQKGLFEMGGNQPVDWIWWGVFRCTFGLYDLWFFSHAALIMLWCDDRSCSKCRRELQFVSRIRVRPWSSTTLIWWNICITVTPSIWLQNNTSDQFKKYDWQNRIVLFLISGWLIISGNHKTLNVQTTTIKTWDGINHLLFNTMAGLIPCRAERSWHRQIQQLHHPLEYGLLQLWVCNLIIV